MLRRLRSQTGQTASEYMGVLFVVAALVAAGVASGIAPKVGQRTKELICQIAGLDCSAETEAELSTCVVAEATDKLTLSGEVNVRLFKVKLEGGVEYVRQKRANGQVAVTLKLPISGGIGPKLAKALGVGKLDGTVKAGSVPQVTFILPDDAAANKFAQQIKDSTIAIAAGPIGSRILGKSVDIDIPPIESIAYEANAGLSVSYDVDTVGGYGRGTLDLGPTLGIRKNLTHGKPDSGDITAYYRYAAKGGLQGGLLIGEGFGGALAGDLTLAVTFDSHGKPKNLQLMGQGGYEGKVALRGKFSDLAGALHGIDALDINANAGAGRKAQFQIDLPLDNADVQNATLAFLQGVNPITGSPQSRSEAGSQLWDAIKKNAKVQVRTYDTSSTNSGVNIDAVVAGGGVNYDTTGAELTDALDYVPGQGFVPSAVCHT